MAGSTPATAEVAGSSRDAVRPEGAAGTGAGRGEEGRRSPGVARESMAASVHKTGPAVAEVASA